jgi:predicted RNase H-like nuclease (RuvC/YqgF family)
MQAEEQRGWVLRQNADHHMKLEQAEEMREELNECRKKVVDLKSEIARLHIFLVDKDDDIERQQKLGEAAAQQHKEFHGKKDAVVDDLRSQVKNLRKAILCVHAHTHSLTHRSRASATMYASCSLRSSRPSTT